MTTADVFVPDELVWRAGAPLVVDDPLYRLGPGVLFAPALGAIALGVATRAFEAMCELTQRVSASSRAAIHDRAHVQEAAADAATLLGAARGSLQRAAETLWDVATRGDDTLHARAELWLAGFFAVESVLTTVDRLHRAAGIDALVAGGPLDRTLREAHAMAPYIDAFRSVRPAAGRVVLGLESGHPLL